MNPVIKMLASAIVAAGIAGVGARLGGASLEASLLTAFAASLKDVQAFLVRPYRRGRPPRHVPGQKPPEG